MKRDFADFLNILQKKKIAVLGVGISNEPLLRLLAKYNLDITVFDSMSETSARALALKEKFSVKWSLGKSYLEQLEGFDIIFRTPVIMPHHPYLLREKAKGALITSEMEVFMHYCPAKIFAVTGSDGKSTTTSLIANMLKEQGYKVFWGGNIGHPLLENLAEIDEKDMVVLELSSFQLIDLHESPDVAILTNITPNHLNVHKDFNEYLEAKKQIYRHQNIGNQVVVNGQCCEFAQDYPAMKGQITWFNQRYEATQHRVFSQQDHQLGYRDRNSNQFRPVCCVDDLNILGTFNRQNALAAMAAVIDFVDKDNIKKALIKFQGLQHRLEFIRELNQIKFYESSIDSSPERSKHSISAFIEKQLPLILIMGGQDKKSDYSGLGKIIAAATDKLILCGENANLIEQNVKAEAHLIGKSYRQMQITHVENYEQAVNLAYQTAEAGDSVLLSPAGTSFDRFKNFMERGDCFKAIVQQLT